MKFEWISFQLQTVLWYFTFSVHIYIFFSAFSLDTLVGKWRLLGLGNGQAFLACVKQSDTRSNCKAISGNGAVTDHIFQYNQTLGKYKFGDVFVYIPSITYNGTYKLKIEPSDDWIALWRVLGLDNDYPDTPNTLTLIEQGNQNIVLCR